MKKVLGIIAIIAFIVLLGSVYVVKETEQAIVLQFGKFDRVVNEVGKDNPGLKFKRPFMFETVYKFDKRLLDLNARPTEVITSGQKRLIIDAFAKYQISNPLQFYQSVNNEMNAASRLNLILESALREAIANVPLTDILSENRTEIINRAGERMQKAAASLGLEIVDVRIMRADLPKANSEQIYLRMRTEREQEAKEFRAQGEEEALRIRSRADKDRTVLLANARKEADIIRGSGDAQATKIFAKAFGRDEDFYEFYRTLQAYRQTLNGESTTMVLSPDSEFLKLLEKYNVN